MIMARLHWGCDCGYICNPPAVSLLRPARGTFVEKVAEHKEQIRRRVMNRTLWMLVAVMMTAVATACVGAPAFADGKATQMWRCELGDDTTEDQVEEAAQKWLAAARTMKGGKNLEAYVFFPVAVSNMGQSDMIFAISAPTFAEWGEFWDGYKDSPAAKLDIANKDAIVPTDSGLWEAIKVE